MLDVIRNEIAALVDEFLEAGKYEIEFSAADTRHGLSLQSSVYFYRLSIVPTARRDLLIKDRLAGNLVKTNKLTLLR